MALRGGNSEPVIIRLHLVLHDRGRILSSLTFILYQERQLGSMITDLQWAGSCKYHWDRKPDYPIKRQGPACPRLQMDFGLVQLALATVPYRVLLWI